MRAILLFFILCCNFPLHRAKSRPIASLTSDQEQQFTEQGRIPLEYFYVDDTNQGGKTHYKFSNNTLLQYVQDAKRVLGKYAKKDHKNRQSIHNEDRVYAAMAKYKKSLKDKRVAVLGSQEPWVEALMLACEASEVVTIDYNYLTYSHERIRTISADDFDTFYASSVESFDVVVSISSIDHSGLGRYSDELNPRGDLETMDNIWSILKPGSGILLLTVPIGPDRCIFNLMRRYGRIRLDMLIGDKRRWEIIEKLDWDESMLDNTERSWRKTYEPVIVLRKVSQEEIETASELR